MNADKMQRIQNPKRKPNDCITQLLEKKKTKFMNTNHDDEFN